MNLRSLLPRTLCLVLAIAGASARAQLNYPEIVTLPSSPISSSDFLTVIVPATGCRSLTQPYSQKFNVPILQDTPSVAVVSPTGGSSGTIDIAVNEIAGSCPNGISDAALFALPIVIGKLVPGPYTISYPTHSLSLDIVVSGTTGSPVAPLPGLWAITSEINGSPGRGFQVELQANTLVLTFYGYDSAGSGRFWLASGSYGGNTFTGAMTAYDGGTSFGGSSQSAHAVGNAGTVSVNFTSPTTGWITLPNETTKAISYFRF
jgi:hypothetical protein